MKFKLMNFFLRFFLNISLFSLICELTFDKHNFLTFEIDCFSIQSYDYKNDEKKIERFLIDRKFFLNYEIF